MFKYINFAGVTDIDFNSPLLVLEYIVSTIDPVGKNITNGPAVLSTPFSLLCIPGIGTDQTVQTILSTSQSVCYTRYYDWSDQTFSTWIKSNDNNLLDYEGVWSAATNIPYLENGVGDKGAFYISTNAGTVNFGAGDIVFKKEDVVAYNGVVWQNAGNVSGITNITSPDESILVLDNGQNVGLEIYFSASLNATSTFNAGKLVQVFNENVSINIEDMKLGWNYVFKASTDLTVTLMNGTFIGGTVLSTDTTQFVNANESFTFIKCDQTRVLIK